LGHAVATQVAPEELPSPWRNRASAQSLLPDEHVVPSVSAIQSPNPDVSLRRCVGVRSYIICPDKGTYEEAVAACAYLGGGLVVLDTEAKNMEVSELVWTLLDRPFYIGLSDRDDEGQWQWLSGDNVTYGGWMSGEPNDWGGWEDCAQSNWSHAGKWNDIGCESRQGFVCELTVPGPPETDPVSDPEPPAPPQPTDEAPP